MNKLILSCISFCLLTAPSLAQPQCPGIKIQSPIVPRPVDAAVLHKDCNEAVLRWTGSQGQTYVVTIYYSGDQGSTAAEILPAAAAGRDNYAVAIPLRSNMTLHWSLQAAGTADGRTFYSYPVTGEYECGNNSIVAAPVTNAAARQPQSTPVKNMTTAELVAYPNPTTGELIVKWSSGYTGRARIVISDASGKAIRWFDMNKQLTDQLERINVSSLAPGIYVLQARASDGTWQAATFVKK